MGFNITDPTTQLCEEMVRLIEAAIPESSAQVQGNGGHFEISVSAAAFDGKSMLAQQRLVYGAITHLMAGDNAPVHAIDRMNIAIP
ncbi:MAG: acid stress-induced BolA-like protein IbaG/YrbA [Myxococcota bacterium]|jgi:acid stress-induced BolA-like protein IbaG/YrbA